MNTPAHACTCIHMHAHAGTCMQMHANLCVCIYMHSHACMYMRMRTYASTCMHIRASDHDGDDGENCSESDSPATSAIVNCPKTLKRLKINVTLKNEPKSKHCSDVAEFHQITKKDFVKLAEICGSSMRCEAMRCNAMLCDIVPSYALHEYMPTDTCSCRQPLHSHECLLPTCLHMS